MSIPQVDLNCKWLKPTACVLFAAVFLPLIATFFLSGKSSAEKMLTNMIQPLFLATVVALAIGVVLLGLPFTINEIANSQAATHGSSTALPPATA